MELTATHAEPHAGQVAFAVLMIAFLLWLLLPVRRGHAPSRSGAVKGSVELSLMPLGLALLCGWLVLRALCLMLSTRPGAGASMAAMWGADALGYMVAGFAGSFVAAFFRSGTIFFGPVRFAAHAAAVVLNLVAQLVFVTLVSRETSVYSPAYVSFTSIATVATAVWLVLIPVGVVVSKRPGSDRELPRATAIVLSVLFVVGGLVAWLGRNRLLEIAVIWW